MSGYGEEMLPRFNTLHRAQMGWLSDTAVQLDIANAVVSITSSSVVDSADPRVIAVGVSEFYWLSLRTDPTGVRDGSFDDGLVPLEASWGDVFGPFIGVVYVHYWGSVDGKTVLVAKLGPGDRYVHPCDGVDVSVLALDAANHTALVSIDGYRPECEAAPPIVTVSPLSQTSTSGFSCSDATVFDVSLQLSNPSVGCGHVATSLSVPPALLTSLPRGWTVRVCAVVAVRITMTPRGCSNQQVSWRLARADDSSAVLSGVAMLGATTVSGGVLGQLTGEQWYCGVLHEQWTFTVNDSLSRGLCCSAPCGSYVVTVDDRVVLRSRNPLLRTNFTSTETRALSPWQDVRVDSRSDDERLACATVEVRVVADANPSQVAWRLVRARDSVMVLGGAGPGSDSTAHCDRLGETLLFSIFDWGRDGVCCSFGNGSYVVTVDGTVVASGKHFYERATTRFHFLGVAASTGSGRPVVVTARVDVDGGVGSGSVPLQFRASNAHGVVDSEPLLLSRVCDGGGGEDTVTASASPVPEVDAAVRNSFVVLSGSSAAVSIPSTGLQVGAGSFSVSLFVAATRQYGYAALASNKVVDWSASPFLASPGWAIMFGGGGGRLWVAIGDGDTAAMVVTGLYAATSADAVRRWRHVALTVNRDTQTMTVYVDGVGLGTASTAAVGSVSNDLPVVVGNDATLSYTDPHSSNHVDEVRLWRRALSAADVKLLSSWPLCAIASLPSTFASALVLRLGFDTPASDNSGSAGGSVTVSTAGVSASSELLTACVSASSSVTPLPSVSPSSSVATSASASPLSSVTTSPSPSQLASPSVVPRDAALSYIVLHREAYVSLPVLGGAAGSDGSVDNLNATEGFTMSLFVRAQLYQSELPYTRCSAFVLSDGVAVPSPFSSARRGWVLSVEWGGTVMFMMSDGNLLQPLELHSYTIVADGLWHHVIVELQPESRVLRLHVDGVTEGVARLPAAPAAVPLRVSNAGVNVGHAPLVGRVWPDEQTCWHDGTVVDDVHVWSVHVPAAPAMRWTGGRVGQLLPSLCDAGAASASLEESPDVRASLALQLRFDECGGAVTAFAARGVAAGLAALHPDARSPAAPASMWPASGCDAACPTVRSASRTVTRSRTPPPPSPSRSASLSGSQSPSQSLTSSKSSRASSSGSASTSRSSTSSRSRSASASASASRSSSPSTSVRPPSSSASPTPSASKSVSSSSSASSSSSSSSASSRRPSGSLSRSSTVSRSPSSSASSSVSSSPSLTSSSSGTRSLTSSSSATRSRSPSRSASRSVTGSTSVSASASRSKSVSGSKTSSKSRSASRSPSKSHTSSRTATRSTTSSKTASRSVTASRSSTATKAKTPR